MKIELVVALVSAAVALVTLGFTFWGQIRTTRLADKLESLRLAEQRRFDAEQTSARYREPLARAAYDLQSRLYNVLQQDFLGAYYDAGDPRERSYAVDNTTFLIAQYFAWTEIVRRDLQYIDLGQSEPTRRLARLQDDIYSLFSTDRFPRILRVFAGEQRAIGDRMIKKGKQCLECCGYAAYLDNVVLSGDRLIDALSDDVKILSTNLDTARPRLIVLQQALVDLLVFLDPDFVRFPKERRTKVPA
ncbi:MAG: hypothetical protein ABJC13_25035 [Acidobacteriota bacterium]